MSNIIRRSISSLVIVSAVGIGAGSSLGLLLDETPEEMEEVPRLHWSVGSSGKAPEEKEALVC